MLRKATLLVVIGGALAAAPAVGQVIFNDSPPRPPADVPNGGFPPQPPPVQYPGQQYPGQQQYPAQQAPPPQYPAQQRAPAPSPAARAPSGMPSGIQAQPLPPPPGATVAPPSARPANAPPPPSPTAPTQGARNTPAPANPPPAQPADTAPQPDDTVVTETPTQKIENARAVFSGLDKITGRTISFDAAIGETVQFGALQVTARACYTRPPTEATNTDAFVEVDEVTLQGEIKRIFTGWMFAASPGLHAVEHPIYDVWLTDCTGPVGGPVADSTPTPAPAAVPPAAGAKGVKPTTPARQVAPARPPIAPPPPAQAPATDD
ncbi:MAG TPA: DUF2155 domain-containing protein [Xanthobacteraceae bacterium]|jgi:hypothetical protein|nr:DUF2155 domain-containing protein [Xanthobacteraceae bacterium]